LAVSENELRLSSARENQIVVTIAFPTATKIRFREKKYFGVRGKFGAEIQLELGARIRFKG